MKGSICLNDKMNCWGHENYQLFVASVLDDMLISNVFDEHHSYHSLPSTSFQHCNCVLSFCDFEHFHLISVKHKDTFTTKFFKMLLKYKPTKVKEKNNNNLLGMKCLISGEDCDSWREMSRAVRPMSESEAISSSSLELLIFQNVELC